MEAFLTQREDGDEELDVPHFHAWCELSGDDTIRTMTNFSSTEFNVLWSLVEVELTSEWTMGRGRKPTQTPKGTMALSSSVRSHRQALQSVLLVTTSEVHPIS
ncbi:TPA: hypothetical protein N0F65_000649 [Lagenidium giganteum]|uniref:Uncharacterized protein n=1 Tax=Lagenidium giganteum TaxID=4803 RepID=A0AAV2YQT2_9STRA|nr:TPA: hypothetical protein N0F65_000649 [Lagenidium giganteum]